jgi:hypothetical protein
VTATICPDCGKFKVGMFSRCTKCPGQPLEDDAGDRFYFSEWGTPSERLHEYSAVIKALALTGEDSSLRRLALLRFIQRYYHGSVSLERDAAAIERADKLLEVVHAHRIHRRREIWRRVERCLTWTALIGFCAGKLLHLF